MDPKETEQPTGATPASGSTEPSTPVEHRTTTEEQAPADHGGATSVQEAPSDTASSATEHQAQSNKLVPIIITVVVAAVAAGLVWYFLVGSGSNESLLRQPASVETSQTAGATYPEVVAVVNGQEISRVDFLNSLSSAQQQASFQGMDVSAPGVQSAIEQQALSNVVNTALILQAAAENEIVATTEAVDAEIEQLQSQFGSQEAFEDQVQQAGLTMEELRDDLADQVVVNTYLEQEVLADVPAVTDEEVQALYDEVAAGGNDLPPLEEVREQIEQQLQSTAENELINEAITGLREAAEIMTNI